MSFLLALPDRVITYAEPATYHFNQYGHLVVDDGTRRYTYSPQSWTSIEEEQSTADTP
jgi:hypothetical protein